MVISVRNLLLLLGLGLAVGMSARSVHAQIPPGYEVIRLTDDPDNDDRPTINNLGHVVWSKRIDREGGATEIFLWDGLQVHRLTNDDLVDVFPDINDYGTIVWSRAKRPGEPNNLDIVLWRNGELTQVTDDELRDSVASINNLDHVAWYQTIGGGCTGLADIFFYDGARIRQITDTGPGLLDQAVEINDFDEIAWTRYDFCQNPWMGTIMLYSNGDIIEVSDGMGQDQSATLNNRLDLAWSNGYPDPNGIVLLSDEGTRQVTDWGRVPRLNNRGDIAFIRFHDDMDVFQQWLWIGENEFRLSDDLETNVSGSINDCGEVVWRSGSLPEMDIILMRMIPGDGDRSGGANLGDLTAFWNCLTGPRAGRRTCITPTTDMDRDGDVDLYDFTILQEQGEGSEEINPLLSCMTGPLPPKDDCVCRAMDMDFDRDTDLRDFSLLQSAFSRAP